VKTIPHRHHAAGKRKIRHRLDKPVTAPSPQPVFTASNIQYEAATKTQAISCGGIGAIQLLVRKLVGCSPIFGPLEMEVRNNVLTHAYASWRWPFSQLLSCHMPH
jgi:hypothetical protein